MRTSSGTPRVLVGAGPMSDDARRVWTGQPEISAIVRYEHADPTGRRFGRRVLGIGLDGCLTALKALLRHPRSRFIATNPWIAVPLVLCGRDVWTTGIYAVPGSASWRLLRRVLGDRPVVSTCHAEVEEWNAEGGRSAFVRYGRSFGVVPRAPRTGPVRVFVGGTSDRDADLIERLVAEVCASEDVELVVVTGSARPGHVTEERVHYPGWVSQDAFVDLICASDVVFLPLRAADRAAGHMVAVAALEAGRPVVTTPSRGMEGYVDGVAVTELDPSGPLLPALEHAAREGRRLGPDVHRGRWVSHHSPDQNAANVLAALAELDRSRP